MRPEEKVLPSLVNPFPNNNLLDLSKLKAFSHDESTMANYRMIQFKWFNSLPHSRLLRTLKKKPFVNIVGKEENAGNQHFLLFPQCFLPYELFTTQSRLLTTKKKKPFENIVGKRENAGSQHFLLFPQCFLPYERQK